MSSFRSVFAFREMVIRKFRGAKPWIHLATTILLLQNSGVLAFISSRLTQGNPQYLPTRLPKYSAVYSSQRPLEQIIFELETRGIQFPPTATRLELEDLLSQTNRRVGLRDYGPESSSPESSRSPNHGSQQDAKRVQRSPTTLNAQREYTMRVESSRSRRSRDRQAGVEFESKDENNRGRETRRRRRKRRAQSRQPAFSTGTLFRLVDNASRKMARAVPDEFVEFGSKATRLASRVTKEVFDELVDVTFHDLQSPSTKRRSSKTRVRPQSSVNRNGRRTRIDQGEKNTQRVTESFSSSSLRAARSPHAPGDEEKSISHGQKTGSQVVEMDGNPSVMDPKAGQNKRRKVPVGKILAELDSRNILYPPTATRQELEMLLKESRPKDEDNVDQKYQVAHRTGGTTPRNVNNDYDDFNGYTSVEDAYEKRSLWARASHVSFKKARAIQREVKEEVKSKANTAYRKAKSRVSGLFSSYQNDVKDPSDDSSTPIVVDAIVEDITVADWDDSDVIVVQPYRAPQSTRSQRKRPGAKATPRATGSEWRDQGPVAETSHDNIDRLWPTDAEGATTPKTDKSSYGTSSGTFHLPPKSSFLREKKRTSSSTRNLNASSGRKMYSPYRKGEDDVSTHGYVDGLDQLGNFVANAMDSFLWGSDDEAKDGSSAGSSKGQPTSTDTGGPRRRSGHWKDRMEEQLDYLLGIHQDGKYYNRWVDQEHENEENVEGSDAVSYARGRSTRTGSKRRVYENPMWEDEDSLLARLFGVDKEARGRNQLFHQQTSFLGSGSIVKILRTVVRSSTLLAGGVCRWASVKGSIPQPVVVVGVLSAFLSSRPGAGIRNVFLALLAIRTLAEVMHGYLYDDSDFWEPCEEDTDMKM